jgi:hypothetical protein
LRTESVDSKKVVFPKEKFVFRQENLMNTTQEIINECLPLIRPLAIGRYAISIGGSHGKKLFDEKSDIDFRLFCDEMLGGIGITETDEWKSFSKVVDRWREKGINIDHCWIRTVKEIDDQLEPWFAGQVPRVDLVWTLWGYHLLTDLANQVILEDPNGLITGWQARLTPYPQVIQGAIIKKHAESLNYWKVDYHYRNKVERGDSVFLASMAARLVNDMMQVLFALNQTYYCGDGNNLRYTSKFSIKPLNFEERIYGILYPSQVEDPFREQYRAIIDLIDDVLFLVNKTNQDY